MGLLAALALPVSARADVELDPATDTVRVAGRLDGALTGPAAGAAAPIGLAYVREHRRALGLTAADLDTLGTPTVRADSGVRQVRWRQEVDGITVADAELRVNVDSDGRVINVLGSPATDLPADTTPLLAKPDPDAELAIYDGRLAYRYTDEVAPTEIYDTIADADTGKVLKRTNLVKSSTALVWDNHPSLDVAATRVDLAPWLLSPATTRLEGPWVHAYADVNGTNAVTNIPRTAQSTFEYPFVSAFSPAGVGCSNAKPCSWNGANDTVATNRAQSTVQAFYLANRFRDHLAAAPIGFDGFSGADKIRLETGNGSSRNNANMYTPPEGEQPRMQMYLWSGSGYRSVNSADDASILFHEYTHGLTGRLVVDADGVQALGSWQSGAMGEGWSDFYAKDYLVSQGHETDDPGAPGEIDMGAYVDATAHAMRNAALDCPVGAPAAACPGRGYTYGDFAKLAGGPEFHADGEIWAQTLWDLRTALTADPGVTLAIVTQALRLSPPEPSFLDMRNAILQADTALYAGTHHTAIWTAFAGRGMGFFASSADGADTAPLEDFSLPPAGGPRGSLTGTVTDLGVPVAGATVTLGPRVVKTLADGTYVIDDLPVAQYAHVAVTAPGFDRLVLDDVAVPGEADAPLRRNWASVRGGATVTSLTVGAENAPIGCGPKQAVDGLQSSTWSTQQGADKPLVVKLPRPTDITGLGIDPTAGCGDLGGSSMAQYTVEVGTGPTGPWTQIASGTFNATHRNRLNAVPATATGADYVRITPMTTQTLNASYIDLSEFAVYGTPSFEARILSGPVAPVASAQFTFSGFGVTSFECRVDAEDFLPCSSPYTTGPLSNGAHRFEVQGVNGPERTTVAGRDFVINTSLPETAFTQTPPALTNATSVVFGFTGGTSYRCAIDGSAFSACTSGQSWAVGEGPHTFVVRAVNNVGEDATPAVHSFTVDTTPPDTVITWGPPPVLTARSFAFAFAAAEAATFTCSVDGLPAVACASPFTVTGFGDGAHSVVVTATDAAGNTGPPARSDFTVAIPALPPSASPTPTATPTVTPRRNALTSATVPKTVSRKTGKVKVTLRGVRGAKVSVQAKAGSRVVGKTTRTLRGSSLSFQLTLDRKRLKSGATVTVRVQATGSGLTTVTRTLRFRLKA